MQGIIRLIINANSTEAPWRLHVQIRKGIAVITQYQREIKTYLLQTMRWMSCDHSLTEVRTSQLAGATLPVLVNSNQKGRCVHIGCLNDAQLRK